MLLGMVQSWAREKPVQKAESVAGGLGGGGRLEGLVGGRWESPGRLCVNQEMKEPQFSDLRMSGLDKTALLGSSQPNSRV